MEELALGAKAATEEAVANRLVRRVLEYFIVDVNAFVDIPFCR